MAVGMLKRNMQQCILICSLGSLLGLFAIYSSYDIAVGTSGMPTTLGSGGVGKGGIRDGTEGDISSVPLLHLSEM